MWSIISNAKVVQNDENPCQTGILVGDKVYPIGGGMGGSDWNAKEGEPGHVLNRTHYKVMGEIASGTFIENEENIIPASVHLVAGKDYLVTYAGQTYTCKAYEITLDAPAVAIGNSFAFGGEDTGEPFLFIDLTAYGIGGYMGIDYENAPEVNVRIEGEIVVPIPAEYMINAFPYYITVYFTKDSQGNVDSLTCTDTVANVEAVLKSGRQIAVKYTVQGGENTMFQILQLVLVYPTDPNYGSQLSFMCKGDILGAKSSENWVILKPQEDGTYLVDTTAFND